MFEDKKSDLHCHLNGSFSLEFLEKTAIKNKCPHVFAEFAHLRKLYLQNKDQPDTGYPEEQLNLVWKLFGLIHLMIQDLDDIMQGVIDVVNHSGRYLEIRTTPKAMAGKTVEDYIVHFEFALHMINGPKHQVRGLLSLDRTQHNVADAEYFIQRIKKSRPHTLVGLDIGGNPLKARTLTGEGLAQVITLALDNGIGIAIHLGESDTDIEKKDTDIILSTLAQWKKTHAPNNEQFFAGKVRLAHCIYLTPEQKEIVCDLGLPVEVCPTCHSKLNWHLKNQPHPATGIYSDLKDNLVVGTDDVSIFGGTIKDEYQQFWGFFKNEDGLSHKEIKERQARFRFD